MVDWVEDWQKHVDSWQAKATSDNTPFELFFGVDTGATNTRVALGTRTEFIFIVEKFKCSSTRTLVVFLHEIDKKLVELNYSKYIQSGCIAAAGRVSLTGDFVDITNYVGGKEDCELSISELPTNVFPVGKSRIIHDLESACYGITGVNSLQQLPKYFEIIAGPNPLDISLKNQHYLVIAVGTGMGVGLLMTTASGFKVLPLEGGHVLFNPCAPDDPRRDEETDMINFLSKKIYNNEYALEYEDLVSGRGVVDLYKWITHNKPEASQDLTAAEIVEQATNKSNEHAVKALLYHYLYTVRAAANLAVCFSAQGIFLAGDNQVTNKQFVTEHFNNLYNNEFKKHPKSKWIDNIPIYSQIEYLNLNIEGTLHICRNELAKQ